MSNTDEGATNDITDNNEPHNKTESTKMNTMRNRSFFQSGGPRSTTQTSNTQQINNNVVSSNSNPHHQRKAMSSTEAEYFAIKVDPSTDDADVAAGQKLYYAGNRLFPSFESNDLSSAASSLVGSAPSSANTVNTINTFKGHPTELEFTEDLIAEPVLVLGVDITHMNPQTQFLVCASGLFFFSLLYGYLQELLSVELCSRQLGLFLAMVQFSGYTGLAYFLRNFVYEKRKRTIEQQALLKQSSLSLDQLDNSTHIKENADKMANSRSVVHVPIRLYLGLSILRAIDLAMTNLAMQYINYPAKTLMKSSRVVFTMLFGVLIQRKKYKTIDYIVVAAMVAGLALFMHADATSSAVFHHMGVIMLTISLTCDGAISNMSETMMSQYGIGQDEFIFRMYSIALLAITLAAAVKGDLKEGIFWMFQSGTYAQYRDNAPMSERVWSVHGKILVMFLFSSMGFFGSSCSAAITKNFGALTMSITSTARKATTLFLSFFLFNNVCTSEHIAGIVLFISALTTKSLRRRNNNKGGSDSPKRRKLKSSIYNANINPNPNVQINAVVEVMQRAKSPGRNNAKKRTITDKLLVAPGMDPTVPTSGALNTNLVHVV